MTPTLLLVLLTSYLVYLEDCRTVKPKDGVCICAYTHVLANLKMGNSVKDRH